MTHDMEKGHYISNKTFHSVYLFFCVKSYYLLLISPIKHELLQL